METKIALVSSLHLRGNKKTLSRKRGKSECNRHEAGRVRWGQFDQEILHQLVEEGLRADRMGRVDSKGNATINAKGNATGQKVILVDCDDTVR